VNKILVASMAFVSTSAFAEDAKVINVEPRYVTVQIQQCENVNVRNDNGTMGSIIGGVAGGLLGSTVGGGSGQIASSVVGAVAGTMVGNSIGSNQQQYRTMQNCYSIPQTVRKGDFVTFSYRGRTFTQIVE
jgi:uncharacterized protein YcfJ